MIDLETGKPVGLRIAGSEPPTEIHDYETGKLIATEVPVLPGPVRPTKPAGVAEPDEEVTVEILDC